MEQLGVIRKENEPTDWVNSLAFSSKANGKLRICLDPKDLNKVIKRTHHKIPTLGEISHKFRDARYFSKLDAQHGYWAIHLDESSSKLTTFNSPFGRYRFLRLPFGLNVSQDIFQMKMDQILERCPSTLGISDDVCVFGRTEEEHDKNLLNLMEVSRAKGLVFNSSKCAIKQPQISFYGLIWDEEGIHPDPAKCDNIKEKPAPTTVKELQQFMGIIQYMSPFIPKLSSHTDPLRKLLHKDAAWQWTETHQKSFEKIKSLIQKEMTLSYYDPNKATVLEVDSSLTGIGAALLQDEKPIAFASKSMTDTESRYANIERELLAVVFALERFHTYIYGRAVLVQSDHKPLENIQHKNLSKAPPRLQRMLLRIQPYSCTMQYKAVKEMIFADYLSRHLNTFWREPCPSCQRKLFQMLPTVQVCTVREKVHFYLVNKQEGSPFLACKVAPFSISAVTVEQE
ncbi:transposon Ty3-I Gag-Pol polyprotein [Elysia marginata]|uniref:Transposon Ty3-I Gag-Pol polyprotein n=1 Tax=Elysia marginata TaxID=1093978 RepID=A0AAV4H200_9GAST|nr:transposon Ty3-I Gag-Pol polyprotein [Elysia marginata]